MNLRNITKHTFSNLLIQVLGIILTLLILKYLTVEEIGKYNLAKGFSQLFLYTHLGLKFSLDRRLPLSSYFLGLKLLSFVLIVNFCFSILILIYIVIFYGFDYYYIAFSIGGMMFAFFLIIKTYYRGIGDVKNFITSNFISGILPVIMSLIGVIKYGINGLTIAYLFSSGIVLILFFKNKFILKRIEFKRSYIRNFFIFGIPLFLSGLFSYVSDTADKFIIESYTDIGFVGKFSIITLIYSFGLIIPSSLLELFFQEYIKHKNNKRLLIKTIKKHFIIGLFLILFIVVFTHLFISLIINWLYPQYCYLIQNIKIMIYGILPYTLIPICWSLLFSNNKGKQLMIVTGVSGFLYIGILLLSLNVDSNLDSIIIAKVVYSYIYLFLLLVSCFTLKVVPFRS